MNEVMFTRPFGRDCLLRYNHWLRGNLVVASFYLFIAMYLIMLGWLTILVMYLVMLGWLPIFWLISTALCSSCCPQVHRLVIVDNNNRVEGMLSLSDVLHFLIISPLGKYESTVSWFSATTTVRTGLPLTINALIIIDI